MFSLPVFFLACMFCMKPFEQTLHSATPGLFSGPEHGLCVPCMFILKRDSNILGESQLPITKKEHQKFSKLAETMKCYRGRNKHKLYYAVTEGWKLRLTWAKNMPPNIHNVMYQTSIILQPRTDHPMWFITQMTTCSHTHSDNDFANSLWHS